MTQGSGIETYANGANSQPAASDGAASQVRDKSLRRALLFVGIAAASAGIAFAIVRATLARPPSDPTTERIQQLIDEANRLLKQLDEKKPG
ncbi:MAG: hypothetical protein WAJ85_12425 [Candidatus Baltobacteraceae bacterium]|jgi:predicted Abi (CAAX) family protease